MKHLLSGLPSLKISSRAENEAIRRMLEGNFSDEDMSPIVDEIDRPKLALSLEMQLRDACETLVELTGNADKESTGNAEFELLMSKSKKTTRSHSRPRPEKYRKHDGKVEPMPEWKDMPAKLGLEPPLSKAVNDVDNNNSTMDKRKLTKERQSLTRLDTAVKVPDLSKEARVAATGHSSNTSESVIMSASTDNNPLSASTSLTSAPLSPVNKPIESLTQPKRIPSESLEEQPFGVVSVTRPKTAMQEEAVAATTPTDTKLKRASFGATLMSIVRRKRSSTLSKPQQEQEAERSTSSSNGVLRRFSMRKNKSTGHLPLEKDTGDELVPPVPKLADANLRYAKAEPVHFPVAKPSGTSNIVKPATPVSIRSTRANIVEVPRSAKRSLTKIDNSSMPNLSLEARRKPSVAGSSIDSCFTPPLPQTPDRQGQIAAALGHKQRGGGGSIDIIKATKSLENLRTFSNRPSTAGASAVALPDFDLPMPTFGISFSTGLPMFNSGPPSRRDSRGIAMASIAATSVQSSRAPSRGGSRTIARAPSPQKQARDAMPPPPPPIAPKYSIMPNGAAYQKQLDKDREHTKSPSQNIVAARPGSSHRPSSSHRPASSRRASSSHMPKSINRASSGPRQMFHPLCMNPTGSGALSNLSSANSSVVHLPSQTLSRSGTFPSETASIGTVSRSTRSNTFTTIHVSKSHHDLPNTTGHRINISAELAKRNFNPSNANSRPQTATSTFLGLPMDHTSSVATSTRNSTINFSRKFTAPEDDVWKKESEFVEPEITALPPVPRPTKRGGLRRVLSSFTVMKARKVAV